MIKTHMDQTKKNQPPSFWASSVIRGLSLAKGPRVESSLPQAFLKSKEGWPGGLLKDRSGAQALIPLLKGGLGPGLLTGL